MILAKRAEANAELRRRTIAAPKALRKLAALWFCHTGAAGLNPPAQFPQAMLFDEGLNRFPEPAELILTCYSKYSLAHGWMSVTEVNHTG